MSNLALRLNGIGKQYRIGSEVIRSESFSQSVVNAVKAPFQNLKFLRSLSNFEDEDDESIFWALRDVSFEVSHGEVVGLIGRNGAGKSTLLKVLSRITEPSEGRIEVYGRIASLLEVGTGFNNELTGRENTYLNGAILGMSKAEVDRKFDEIVDFSGIEKFIDTPVKRYSSGMKVRLGFAIAAHLEPDILLVDEVLAVGDVEFQAKCLGKMDDVAGEGRTVIFVSHQMPMIQALCRRGILLKDGAVSYDGDVDSAISRYLKDNEGGDVVDPFGDNPKRSGTHEAVFTSVDILDGLGESTTNLIAGQPATFRFGYKNTVPDVEPILTCVINDGLSVPVANFRSDLTDFIPRLGEEGILVCHIERLPLLPGVYNLNCQIRFGDHVVDGIPNLKTFQVASSVFFENGRTPNPKYSAFMVDHEWKHTAAAVEVGALPDT